MAFKMNGHALPGIKQRSPLNHEPWFAAHKEKVAHSGTAEAHGKKRGTPPKKDPPKKAHYGSSSPAGSQTYSEYAASLRDDSPVKDKFKDVMYGRALPEVKIVEKGVKPRKKYKHNFKSTTAQVKTTTKKLKKKPKNIVKSRIKVKQTVDSQTMGVAGHTAYSKGLNLKT